MNAGTVKGYLARHRAHITIPQDLDFFYQPDDPNTEGKHVIRVDAVWDDGELECTIVHGPWPEVGKTVNFPYKPVKRQGQETSGLFRLIKDQRVKDICVRGEEWIEDYQLGINEEDEVKIHPGLVQYWAKTKHRHRVQQYSLRYPRVEKDASGPRMEIQCSRCGQRLFSTQCRAQCYPSQASQLPTVTTQRSSTTGIRSGGGTKG
eukprot:3781278-Rhodomonas_salina.2